MKRTYVYIVATGERGRGTEPVAAFRSLLLAKKWANQVYDVSPVWLGGGHWMASRNEVDQVWIYRQVIR